MYEVQLTGGIIRCDTPREAMAIVRALGRDPEMQRLALLAEIAQGLATVERELAELRVQFVPLLAADHVAPAEPPAREREEHP